ncbi:HAD family hydrolase [Kitasatospora sp. NPDC094016]|uniref:HAD family hydrolase n=1 Tax=Kitasatospora sp. NPDC094016 TaxID=3154986 RepID=UPI003322346D
MSNIDPAFSLFSRVKVGPGRSAGYRMGNLKLLEELRASGAVVYENVRYDSVYVTDRPGLDEAFAHGVPVMHLGQVDGVRAVLDRYPAQWLTVLLWCPREITESRSTGRADADTPARLAAWDATRADLDANPDFSFDLTIRTDEVGHEAAAAQIRQALTAPRADGDLVLIDFDDTLVDRLAAVTTWVADYCSGHGLGPKAEQRMLEAMRIRADLDVIEGLCTELGLPESANELWSRYEPELASSVQPFPGVTDALTAVREAGHQVVVVTNGGARIQSAKLSASGITDVVDAACISGAIGVRKPELGIFEAAAASVGRHLGQGGWMIGDNADLDVVGGRNAGLRTIWISHGRKWPGPDGAKPDSIAQDAVEALAHIAGGAR